MINDVMEAEKLAEIVLIVRQIFAIISYRNMSNHPRTTARANAHDTIRYDYHHYLLFIFIPGVRESRHIQTGPTADWRSPGTRGLLCHPLC